MATLTFHDESYTVDHATKGVDYIHGFDENGTLIVSFDGVTDFSCFTYDGDFMAPSDCLTERCNTVVHCRGKFKKADGTDVTPILYGSAEPTEAPVSGEGTIYVRTGGDAVVEAGITDGWTWRKWASGIAECWCNYTVSGVTATSSWGSMYESNKHDLCDYPFAFTKVPTQNIHVIGTSEGSAFFMYQYGDTGPTATSAGKINFYRPTSAKTEQDVYLSIQVIGRWK